MISTAEACRLDLFSPAEALREKYPEVLVSRIVRIRDMYAYFLANPDTKDRELVDELIRRHGVNKSAAYGDLSIIKQLLPMIGQASREFHRWRFNEMILETYRLAKKKGDRRTMEKAASSYAKYNRIDMDDEKVLPYDQIVVQPFTATEDPTVLGIKPIPRLQEKIDALLAKYSAESMDVEDVDYEEADLEEDELFNDDKSGDDEARIL